MAVSIESDKKWFEELILRLITINANLSLIKHPSNTDYHIMHRNQLFRFEKVKSVVDLGVHFDSNLTFRDFTANLTGTENRSEDVIK